MMFASLSKVAKNHKRRNIELKSSRDVVPEYSYSLLSDNGKYPRIIFTGTFYYRKLVET